MSLLFQLSLQGFTSFLVNIDNDDVGALVYKQTRASFSNALGATRDQAHFFV
jgi:sRNA-binding regulator protein Hfq